MISQKPQVRLTDLIGPAYYELHWDIIEGRHSIYHLPGGRGSLKSSFASLEIILGMMQDANDGLITNAVVFRRYFNDLHDSVYKQLVWAIDKLGVSHEWRMTTSPLRLIYKQTGQEILFRGADKVTKAKSIKCARGYIKYLWIEELDEFEGPEKFRSIRQSVVRGGPEFCTFATYNPPKSLRSWVNDPVHWNRADTATLRTTYLSAPREWLGEQFFNEVEALKATNEKAYTHEYLGVAIGTDAAIFNNIVARTITDDEIKKFDRLYNGLDWGFYPDPWAFNRMHYDAARKRLYIFGELTRVKLGNRETADALIAFGIKGADRITADSAEPKSVSDYKKYGFNCRGAIKGPGSVDYSHKWLQSLAEIIIDSERCPDTYEEFTEYEHERDKDGKVIDGYPDKNNHHIDAVRYGMEPVFRRRGQ